MDKDYKGNSAIKALYMLDEETGYAVGEGGLILKRTGPAFVETTVSGLNIKSISLIRCRSGLRRI